MLNLPASITVRNTFLLLKPPSLHYFCEIPSKIGKIGAMCVPRTPLGESVLREESMKAGACVLGLAWLPSLFLPFTEKETALDV